MPLTPAEKQFRYRQRVKQDPLKYAEIKRKRLERYAAENKIDERKMPLTPAEKQLRYRQRIKQDPLKYAAAKRKHLERYHAKKILENNCPINEGKIPLTLAEKQLRYRLKVKQDPIKYAEIRRKRLERYAAEKKIENCPINERKMPLINERKKPLTPAEKQFRYRQRIKQDPLKYAEFKRKRLEQNNAKKKLEKDKKAQEQLVKRKWNNADEKGREPHKEPKPIVANTPTSIITRGRKQMVKETLETSDIQSPQSISNEITIKEEPTCSNSLNWNNTSKPKTEADPNLIELVNKIVFEWFNRAQTRIEAGKITNKMFLQKAQECVQILSIKDFKPNQEWVKKFKKKHKITKLDMTLLRIESDSKPTSIDINEIIIHVLENNPIADISLNNIDIEDAKLIDIELSTVSEQVPNSHTPVEIDAITNHEQARRHLKLLEEYVLMLENFRAIGLVSQLEEIFSADAIKKEK